MEMKVEIRKVLPDRSNIGFYRRQRRLTAFPAISFGQFKARTGTSFQARGDNTVPGATRHWDSRRTWVGGDPIACFSANDCSQCRLQASGAFGWSWIG